MQNTWLSEKVVAMVGETNKYRATRLAHILLAARDIMEAVHHPSHMTSRFGSTEKMVWVVCDRMKEWLMSDTRTIQVGRPHLASCSRG